MPTDLEKKVIVALQGDMPIISQPYRRLAETLNVSQATFLKALQSLCDKGVIRRLGATIRHQRSGFTANAMAAWQVSAEHIDRVGALFADWDAVSHCYQRRPAAGWPFNLYTMIHADSEHACRAIASSMARQASVDTYVLLFSRREWKKTSMVYVAEPS